MAASTGAISAPVQARPPFAEAPVLNGVKIVGYTNLPGRIAADASALYARNLVAFVGLMLKDGAVTLDLEDEILKAAVVTHGGAVVHEGVKG